MIKKQKWLEEPGCLRLPVSAALTPQTGSPDLRPAQRERRKQTGPGPRSQRLVTFLKRKKEKRKKSGLAGGGEGSQGHPRQGPLQPQPSKQPGQQPCRGRSTRQSGQTAP